MHSLLQPPKNSLGIFTPTWFTSATFLSKDDHRKIIAGTNNHQVIGLNEFLCSCKYQWMIYLDFSPDMIIFIAPFFFGGRRFVELLYETGILLFAGASL